MKTTPMAHQKEGLARLAAAPEFFALGAEPGTGKTWMLLADAAAQFEAGRIDGLVVVAPKGVHTNWVLREIPTHMSIPVRAEFWLSGASRERMARLAKLLVPDPEKLAILTINVDALNTEKGFNYVDRFMTIYRCMMVIDESQRIKNPAARRTKRAHLLGRKAVSRRIASGTLVADKPVDLFGQYEFLAPGLLGTTSLRAFTAEYTELLPDHHPLVAAIARKSRGGRPQVPRTDANGRPVYRNLDKLRRLMAPHTFRVLKKDCLDLPPKIYQTRYFELSSSQRRLYEQVKEELRYEHADGEVDIFNAMTAINKLRQLTSGFILSEGRAIALADHGPRLSALTEQVEELEGQIIIWASFREEIRILAETFGDEAVTYHGGTSPKDREAAIELFQSGEKRFFIGHPAAAGTGLTLTAATTAIYYSCGFSLEERMQSEDRCHRIGTTEPVLYIDLVARDTVDERIAAALTSKRQTADAILDPRAFVSNILGV